MFLPLCDGTIKFVQDQDRDQKYDGTGTRIKAWTRNMKGPGTGPRTGASFGPGLKPGPGLGPEPWPRMGQGLVIRKNIKKCIGNVFLFFLIAVIW